MGRILDVISLVVGIGFKAIPYLLLAFFVFIFIKNINRRKKEVDKKLVFKDYTIITYYTLKTIGDYIKKIFGFIIKKINEAQMEIEKDDRRRTKEGRITKKVNDNASETNREYSSPLESRIGEYGSSGKEERE